jgi:hypothetical protein
VGDSHLSSVLVAFVSKTNKSKTEIAAPSVPGRVQRLALFGPPILLEGEDAAAYDQLFARICSAVKPVDIIEEIFVTDLMSLEWEVLRWRRLKSSLIQARGRKVLQNFLEEQLKSNSALQEEPLKIISRKFSKTTFRKTKRTLRRCWQPSVRRMNLMLTISSVRSLAESD